MVIARGFFLAALGTATITGWVIGISDLYVGRYGNGITLVVLSAVISLLLTKISVRHLDEISKNGLYDQSQPPTGEIDDLLPPIIDDLLPPIIYDTIGYGLIVLAVLVGIGGPLASPDYMGNYLNPAVGIFLFLMGSGVFRLKKNRADSNRAGQTDIITENQTEIQPLP